MTIPEHEKLDVYRRALVVVAALEEVASQFPHDHRGLQDQLRRAAASIPLNIAEGANEFTPGEKARFYRIARRSVGECMAVLDVARTLRIAAPSEDARKELGEILAILTAMVKRLGER